MINVTTTATTRVKYREAAKRITTDKKVEQTFKSTLNKKKQEKERENK